MELGEEAFGVGDVLEQAGAQDDVEAAVADQLEVAEMGVGVQVRARILLADDERVGEPRRVRGVGGVNDERVLIGRQVAEERIEAPAR